jgi:hypothetical protein
MNGKSHISLTIPSFVLSFSKDERMCFSSILS